MKKNNTLKNKSVVIYLINKYLTLKFHKNKAVVNYYIQKKLTLKFNKNKAVANYFIEKKHNLKNKAFAIYLINKKLTLKLRLTIYGEIQIKNLQKIINFMIKMMNKY